MATVGVVSGKDATFTYATGYAESVRDWTINVVIENVDTTKLGDAWKTSRYGVGEWSGTFTTLVEDDNFGTGDSIGDLGLLEDAAAAVFVFSDQTTDGSFTGNIVITGLDSTATVAGGATTATFSFQGSGALSITAAA